MKKRMTFLLTICVVFLLVGLMPVHGETEISDNVLRLHILANSDSEEDQALKLTVRDEILRTGEDLFAGCESREEAICRLQENIGQLTETARQTIAAAGYDYPVRVEFDEESYPTRRYGEICFPAGRYLSLRILIGEAEGQNWWCVLFPPLCMSAAKISEDQREDAFISVGFTGEQYHVITESDRGTYQVRFKILEMMEETFGSQR